MNNTTIAASVVESQKTLSSLAAIVAISLAAGLCSLLTVSGNFFVILAFITNRSLRNFSNYLILNLAISDLIIGLFSMNIYVVYNVTGIWTMGKGMCNAWLTVDYVVSNTSVLNLLVICIDRYMAITCPVKYRRRCTPCAATVVICLAWTISFFLWAPAILLWDITSTNKDDPLDSGACSIPFMQQSPAVTIITALGAFYLPAAAMCTLYWRVIVKIERQTSSVSSIINRATSAISSRYTNSWNPKQIKVFLDKKHGSDEPVNKIVDDGDKSENERVTNKENGAHRDGEGGKMLSVQPMKHSGTDPICKAGKTYDQHLEVKSSNRDSGLDKSSTHLLKKEDTKSNSSPEISDSPHSVTKSEEDSVRNTEKEKPAAVDNPVCNNVGPKRVEKHSRLNNRSSSRSLTHKNNEMRLNREKRATTLLKSILICFISLWLPYNVIVIVSGVCPSCEISDFLWILSYWLCYLNSTANPFCYGYCNENFQRTFKALLTNKWWTTKGRRQMRCQVSGRRSARAV